MSRLHIGVKLCGGCQERYNRLHELETIRAGCDSFADLMFIRPEENYDAVLVVSGCPQRCPDVKKLRSRHGLLWVSSLEETPRIIENLRQMYTASKK